MSNLTDSSEFQEAIRVARELVSQSAVVPRPAGLVHRTLTVHAKPSGHFVAGPTPEQLAAVADPGSLLLDESPPASLPAAMPPQDIAGASDLLIQTPSRLVAPQAAPAPGPVESEFRGDRLENTLFSMCQRGGFIGALIVDDDGLPLAVHNSPVPEGAIGAFAMVLGAALDKSGKLLGQHDADNVSIDINYTDKIVLRRFFVGETPTYLLVVCPQEVDERGEVELSIDQITRVLSRN